QTTKPAFPSIRWPDGLRREKASARVGMPQENTRSHRGSGWMALAWSCHLALGATTSILHRATGPRMLAGLCFLGAVTKKGTVRTVPFGFVPGPRFFKV